MDYVPEESKPGYFDVFNNTENGRKYIVLEGLNPTDIHTPGVLEKWTNKHFDTLATMYWIIFFVTLIYLVGTYIVIPLSNKFNIRLWPSTELRKKP